MCTCTPRGTDDERLEDLFVKVSHRHDQEVEPAAALVPRARKAGATQRR